MTHRRHFPLITLFKKLYYSVEEEATSALTGFHACLLSWSNWNLEMLVFVEEGKLKNPEKNPRSKVKTNNKVNPNMAPGEKGTRATLVEGDHPHYCAISAP